MNAQIPADVRLFHIDNKVTIACRINDAHQVMYYAEAHVHPKDQFCRYTGRVKAIGRLNSGRFRVNCLDLPKFEEFRDQMYNAFDLESALENKEETAQ